MKRPKSTRIADEVEKLIHLGKEKGFLTYDEVNEYLPSDLIAGDQLEDVMSMFGDMDIEVIESSSKGAVSRSRPSRKLQRKNRPRKRKSAISTQEPLERPTTPSACICARWEWSAFSPGKEKSRLRNGSRPANGRSLSRLFIPTLRFRRPSF
jgi:hypothetical protein